MLKILLIGLCRDTAPDVLEFVRCTLKKDEGVSCLAHDLPVPLDHVDGDGVTAEQNAISIMQEMGMHMLMWVDADVTRQVIRSRLVVRPDLTDYSPPFSYDDWIELPMGFSDEIGAALLAAVIAVGAHCIPVVRDDLDDCLDRRLPDMEKLIANPPAGFPDETTRAFRYLAALALATLYLRRDDRGYLEDGLQICLALQMESLSARSSFVADVATMAGMLLTARAKYTDPTENFQIAGSSYLMALDTYDKETDALKWAVVQTCLGDNFQMSGDFHRDPEYLKYAINAYQSARNALDPKQYLREWAAATTGEATALLMINEFAKGNVAVTIAIGFFEAVVAAYDPAADPGKHATASFRLGCALQTLGDLTEDTDVLRRAEAAFNASSSYLSSHSPDQGALARESIAEINDRIREIEGGAIP